MKILRYGTVDLYDDKKVSDKRVFDRQVLLHIQEELPKYLKALGFEIERGREGSERKEKNLTISEFKKMKEEQTIIQILKIIINLLKKIMT